MMLLSQLIVSLLDIFAICILRDTQYGVVILQQLAGQAQVPRQGEGGEGADQVLCQGKHCNSGNHFLENII